VVFHSAAVCIRSQQAFAVLAAITAGLEGDEVCRKFAMLVGQGGNERAVKAEEAFLTEAATAFADTTTVAVVKTLAL